jgi:hypothetical protein
MGNRQDNRKSGRNPDGTFGPGNPGKPKGTRHKATRAALALLEGESEALSRKAVELALAGDTTALRLCLERIAPPRKDAPIAFDLPAMQSAADAAVAAAAVVEAVADGELTPVEGAHVMGLIEAYRKTLETSELEARVAALEEIKC